MSKQHINLMETQQPDYCLSAFQLMLDHNIAVAEYTDTGSDNVSILKNTAIVR